MNALTKNRINSISNLVGVMQQLPQLEAPVKHHFSKGVYVREIFMPKGMLIVGKIHKTRHLNIVSQGSCTVVTPTRKFDVTAPCTFESFEGEQKVVLMHEDVVWSTVHVTEETDLVKLEEECITQEYDEELIKKLGEQLCLGV